VVTTKLLVYDRVRSINQSVVKFYIWTETNCLPEAQARATVVAMTTRCKQQVDRRVDEVVLGCATSDSFMFVNCSSRRQLVVLDSHE